MANGSTSRTPAYGAYGSSNDVFDGRCIFRAGRSANYAARVQDDEEEEDSDDFVVRREGEDDDEDDDDDDDDEDDDEEEEEKRERRRFFDDEAADDSDWESLPESDTLDSTPPSTPSDAGRHATREEAYFGNDPEPGKRKKKPTSSVDPDAGPKTFPLFQRLPTELRLRIWELLCPYSREQRRVFRLTLTDSPLLVPWTLMARQTRAMRQFMSICSESRAVGLRIVPDELPVEYGIIRFNAETDIVHMDHEDEHALCDPAHRYTSRRREEAVLARLPKFPYGHVRNLGIWDCEVRSREPGAYLDYEYGRSIIEFWAADMVSHQSPQELRQEKLVRRYLEFFPKLDNVYVLERANRRRINAWVGDLRPGNHQQFRIHTKEGGEDWQADVDYVYCWHEPPAAWLQKRRADRVARRARKKAEAAARGETGHDVDGDSDGDVGCGTDDETVPPKGSDGKVDGKIEGDWDNEHNVVVNTMALFRDRGVRFSRMLVFELDEGLIFYHQLRRACKPEGAWPIDMDGEPLQDDPPMLEDIGLGGEFMDEEDEYESSGIDDEELEDEEEEGSEDDDDGDAIVHDNEAHAMGANFSSPDEEAPSDGEIGRERRRKRRRVLSDSDDESAGNGEGAAGAAGAGADSDSNGPPPAKRMTLAERLGKVREENPVPDGSEEGEEEGGSEEDAGDYGLQGDEDDEEDEEDEEDEM